MPNLAHRLVTSAGAATVSQLWRIGVTFVTHMALRRMIPPEQFGVWVWVEPLFLVLAQVRDVGFPAHVMRSDKRLYGNFLRLEASWGGLFSLFVLAGAPLIARAYADKDVNVVPYIQALCLFLFVQGLGSVALTFFEAELQVIRALPAEIVRNLAFAVISLVLAWQGYGAWSLVIAHIAAGTIFTAMLWWTALGRAFSPGERIRLDLEPGGTLRLLFASWPLAVMAVLEIMVFRLDAFVLALRFPTEIVGTAGLAMFAVYFFSRYLADPIGRALYPGLARYRHDPQKAFDVYRTATLFLASLVVPTAFFLFTNAELVTLFLGGEKWLGAADYLRVLSLVPLVRPLLMFGPDYLLTRHADRLVMIYTVTNLTSLATLGLVLTATSLGPLGMAVASYFPLGLIPLVWGIRRIDASGLKRLLANLGELYAVAALLFAPILLVFDDSWWRLGLSCVAGLLVLGHAVLRFGKSYREFLQGEE